MTQSTDGWNESASAWLVEQGADGDYGRRHVLDAPMMARVRAQPFATALDVGCGEGRFCRMLQAAGITTTGIDPTQALIERARTLDPTGTYRLERIEDLSDPNESYDLIVSYLSLIDIPDLAPAIRKMVDALRPGGTLLIANLTSFSTAGMPNGWTEAADGSAHFAIDNYLEERAVWVEWRGIRIQNHHRPLQTYMSAFLNANLELRHFAEPAPTGGPKEKADRYRRVPYFHIMEWQKPKISASGVGGHGDVGASQLSAEPGWRERKVSE